MLFLIKLDNQARPRQEVVARRENGGLDEIRETAFALKRCEDLRQSPSPFRVSKVLWRGPDSKTLLALNIAEKCP